MPASVEEAADELDAGALVPGRVRRVEPDQGLEQLDRINLEYTLRTILP